MYKIKAFSSLVGLSVRSLRHYDKIGLLIPEHINRHNGYRHYGSQNLVTAQQILFFKELDFSLAEIKTLLTDETINQQETLCFQRNLLELKRQRLGGMVELIDDILNTEPHGVIDMTEKLKQTINNSQFDDQKATYLAAAKKQWGHTDSFKQSQQRLSTYSQDELAEINEKQASIYRQLAALMPLGVQHQQVHELVHQARMHIDSHWYPCDTKRFVALGQMYVDDPKFQANIDQYGQGLASFLNQAIKAYAKQ